MTNPDFTEETKAVILSMYEIIRRLDEVEENFLTKAALTLTIADGIGQVVGALRTMELIDVETLSAFLEEQQQQANLADRL